MTIFKKDLRAVLILLFIALAAEIFIFNARFFVDTASGAQSKMVFPSSFTAVSKGGVQGGTLCVSDGSSFMLTPNIPVNSVRINTKSGSAFTVRVQYTDAGSAKNFEDAGYAAAQVQNTSLSIRLKTQGNCGTLKFSFSDVEGNPEITSLELNRPYFSFNFIRALLLFAVLFLLYKLSKKELWDENAGFKKPSRRTAIIFVYLAAAFLASLLYLLFNDATGFTSSFGYSGDCYRLLTEAFSRGSLSFMQSPPKELAALSNPYDPSLRNNINYIFDSAYFGGKYYCYFGIAPVITLLLPFKLLTGLYMPTSFACLIYFLAMLAGLSLLYYNLSEKWFASVGRMPYIGGAIALLFGSNLFWLIARPLFYELAPTSALCYLFFAFALLLYLSRGGARRRNLCLFLSGLCFALMVASRPNFILYLAAAVPLLCPMLFKNKRLRLKSSAAFFAPLIVFALILMVYNKLRFGSPFDFGQRYQLTISDVHYNSIANFALLPAGIYHYFFAPLDINMTYPFFHIVQHLSDTSCGYYYNQPMAGFFSFPLLLILFASVYILRRMDKSRRGLKIFTALLIIAALAVTYVDIMLAGVLERYTLDIGPVLILASLVLWFTALDYFRAKGAYTPFAKLFFVFCIATALISLLCSACGENDAQLSASPTIYHSIANLFEFWK